MNITFQKQLNKILILLIFIVVSCDSRNKNKSSARIEINEFINLSDFNLTSVNNKKIEKNKLILLDFWATWCGPCIASFPYLEEIQEKYNNELQVVAISDEKVERVTNYLNKNKINLTFFNDNLEFYHYFRRGATSLDEQYFLRGKTDIRLFPDTFHCFTDEQFSTSHDNTVATILAYDMLIVHLKTQIDKLENSNGMETTNSTLLKPSNLFWTAHKTD